ncbi:MAG: hypothetical protein AB7O62_01500 [Pirellulales bacterium]
MALTLLTIDGGEKIDWSKLTVIPDRRLAIGWLIVCTIVYVSFMLWRHWPRNRFPATG